MVDGLVQTGSNTSIHVPGCGKILGYFLITSDYIEWAEINQFCPKTLLDVSSLFGVSRCKCIYKWHHCHVFRVSPSQHILAGPRSSSFVTCWCCRHQNKHLHCFVWSLVNISQEIVLKNVPSIFVTSSIFIVKCHLKYNKKLFLITMNSKHIFVKLSHLSKYLPAASMTTDNKLSAKIVWTLVQCGCEWCV